MRGKALQLFNSMGREQQTFAPVETDRVRIYSCGPTVYHYAHLGNLRAYVFTDTLRRVLMWKGYETTQVMNITDVGHLTSDADEGEDKMEKAASREHMSVWDIAAHYTQAFQDDLAHLNVLPPQEQPKATDHIPQMIAFTRRLEEQGHCYMLDDGLYFDTSTVPDYGRLGQLDLEGLQEGARVAATQGKRNPTDFVVWRRSPAGAKRLMEWDSPWGVGAPGWHLECSVMSIQYLGNPFDIHTGGVDHRQVHHCNEVAQNMGYLEGGHSGVNYWLHNEFLVQGEEKMAKSKGDFLRLQSVIDHGIHPLSYRYFCLQAQYRKPLEFSWEALKGAQNGLKRLLVRIGNLKDQCDAGHVNALARYQVPSDGASRIDTDWTRLPQPAGQRNWCQALDDAVRDDLNTPKAMAALNEMLADDALAPETALELIAAYDQVLGLRLLEMAPEDLLIRAKEAALSDEAVNALVAERLQARKDRDFARADQIRDELVDKGVQIKDGPDGTTWEWKVS